MDFGLVKFENKFDSDSDSGLTFLLDTNSEVPSQLGSPLVRLRVLDCNDPALAAVAVAAAVVVVVA